MTANSGDSPRRATPLQAAKTVFWAFFGVRRGKDHASIKLTPLQIIMAAVIGAALFVLTIVSVVHFVTR
ncbi:MAG: DUF2970 domain-containing protein [Betaproteobacteria bacterium]|nr:DUF2970 domain-containing protein [Betaproteobacteria bacterium]